MLGEGENQPRPLVTKYMSFVLISGIGLGIATLTLWIGVRLFGLSPFTANFLGDVLAVSFVFVVSAHQTFVHAHHFMLTKFGVYAGWQFLHISAISWAVAALVSWPAFEGPVSALGPVEVIAKLLVTPLTVTANFVVAMLLIEKIRQ
jgi:putative flippase GtrA